MYGPDSCGKGIEVKCRQHEAELRQSREECWAREQELATGREKFALLKATLEDRRKDIVSYKVKLPCIAWYYSPADMFLDG